TVITANGQLYNLDVRYAASPQATQIRFPAGPITPHTLNNMPSQAKLQAIAADLKEDTRFYHGIRASEGKAKARLEGIYIYGSTLFFRVVLTNRSPIPYTLDFYRLRIRDRQQPRRSVRQEQELVPRFVFGKEKQSL